MMGKISPFEILGETFANAFRWVHFFLPVALAAALVGTLLNGYMLESIAVVEGGEAAAVPDNFWTMWSLVMIAIFFVQAVQLSLYDAVMEQNASWLSFGIMRALRRLVPVLIGIVLFVLAYALGTLLLVIPGIMAMFLLYMMMPLILLDDVGPIAALKKSWQLTWGNAWRLFAAMLLTFLPIMLVVWGLAFALGILSMETALQPPTSLSDWRTWAWILFTGVAGMLVASFYLVAFRALKSANADGGELVADAVTA